MEYMGNEKLRKFFDENRSAALGFSGGVDSSYLLYAGIQAGAQIRPYYIKTPFQPAFELADAVRLTRELGVELTVLELNVLDLEKVRSNPGNRCYYCKQALFGALKRQAEADGFSLILDGTNVSDDAGDRPGMQAIQELQVRSPLRECGLTKDMIRQASREAGLFTWNKPAYACLATRVPFGESITEEMLTKIEHGENALFQMGFTDFRIRLFHQAARIQLPAVQMEQAVKMRRQLREGLSPWFQEVLLDLKERP